MGVIRRRLCRRPLCSSFGGRRFLLIRRCQCYGWGDGVVPRRPGGGIIVEVVADDDGVVPGCSGGDVADGGAFEDPVKRWDIGMSPMESMARRPQ